MKRLLWVLLLRSAPTWADCPRIVGVSRYDTLPLPPTGGALDPDAAPPGAKALRLHGFQRMAQVEENLRLVGMAAKRKQWEVGP